jgi:hypothetical protein
MWCLGYYVGYYNSAIKMLLARQKAKNVKTGEWSNENLEKSY